MTSNNPSLTQGNILPILSLGPASLRKPLPVIATNTIADTNIIKRKVSWNGPSFSSSTNNECKPDPEEVAAVIASNPLSASSLYNSKKLWTDFRVSGESVRVAFRYVLDDADDNQVNNDTASLDEVVCLCWIDSDGTPHRFYSVTPSKDHLEVTESDHIETTFAGHGFVFCKRLDDVMVNKILEQSSTTIMKKGEVYVVNNECGTVFLRRKKVNEEGESEYESDDSGCEEGESEYESDESGWETINTEDEYEKQDDCDSCDEDDNDGNASVISHWSFISDEKTDADNDSQDGTNNDIVSGGLSEESINPTDLEGEWDAYVVVGGFRLGTKDVPRDIQVKDEDCENSSDDDSDDDDEWCIQLVTQKQTTASDSKEEDGSARHPLFLRGSQQNGNLKYFNNNHFTLTAKLNSIDPTPISSVSKHYRSITLGGWPCMVEPGALSNRTLRKRIIADLKSACSCLPVHLRRKLQSSTPLWINKSLAYGPKVAPIREANMCFHPDEDWLTRNGMNPAKKGGIEMYKSSAYLDDCSLWGVGGLMLHELSHAFHYLHCQDGFDNSVIRECYDKAMDENLYDCVPFHCDEGKKDRRKAYACTNCMEYFAELSAAFLGGHCDQEFNKWYPFNRSQIKAHDPRAYDMLRQMWGVKNDSRYT